MNYNLVRWPIRDLKNILFNKNINSLRFYYNNNNSPASWICSDLKHPLQLLDLKLKKPIFILTLNPMTIRDSLTYNISNIAIP